MLTDPATGEAALAPRCSSRWHALQAWLVDRIKRAALAHLHASRAGEIVVLRAYMAGEVATELELQADFLGGAPDWLRRQIEQHLLEERGHAAAFAAALAERGASTGLPPPDILSRRKIAQWRGIGQRYQQAFSNGALSAAYVIGLCSEQMAVRVLERHCAVLAPAHPLHPLLARVLADERRHVRLCSHALARLVPAYEQPLLDAMVDEVRRVERSFGVTGAVGMYAAGLWLRCFGRKAAE